MFILFERTKHCHMAFVGWSRATFVNSKNKLREKHKLFQGLTSNNRAENMQEVRRVKEEIYTLLYHDELHWRQHSRFIWLKASDKNTKFFYQRASRLRRKNHLYGVFGGGGNWCEAEEDIARVDEVYFQELFSSSKFNQYRGSVGYN